MLKENSLNSNCDNESKDNSNILKSKLNDNKKKTKKNKIEQKKKEKEKIKEPNNKNGEIYETQNIKLLSSDDTITRKVNKYQEIKLRNLIAKLASERFLN